MSATRSKSKTLCVIVAASAMTMLGCGTEVPGGQQALSARADVAVDELRALATNIRGNLDERRAAEILSHLDYQESVHECMIDAGQIYVAPPFVSLLSGRDGVSLPDDFHAFAEVPTDDALVPSVAADVAAAAKAAQELDLQQVPALSDAHSDALTNCADSTLSRPWPTPSTRLDEAFHALLADITGMPSVQKSANEYPTCMRGYGFSVEDQTSLYLTVYAQFNPFAVDYVDPGKTQQASGPAWDVAVAFEQQAASADRACRSATFAIAMEAIGPRLVGFRQEHSRELTAAQTYWDELERTAAQRLAGSPLRDSLAQISLDSDG